MCYAGSIAAYGIVKCYRRGFGSSAANGYLSPRSFTSFSTSLCLSLFFAAMGT
ncbi:hypothetical protein LX99_04372 [Mucilaginibacter oryzae]|uniref:Uncharacterized protein n=1 Tax=Mucilaginibacter oryzae TaxID=468058 RepID=A0A316HH22_9SPHI|nr:hypothetical protein LX99_04372 [Mucilaginibacter oryzae]